MQGSSIDDGDAPPVVGPPRPSLADRWSELRHDQRLFTFVLVAVALVAGGWWVHQSVSSSAAPSSVASSATTSTTALAAAPAGVATTTASVVIVHVAGSVRHPGVVSLPATARVVDAIEAAGGANAGADVDRLDLAAHLVDGERIAVPRRGAPSDAANPTSDPAGAAGGATGPAAAPSPDAPLDLNTATEAQLEALPGIGPTLAQAIIDERGREGGFHSVDDLRRVKGIGDGRFATLKPLVTV